MPGAGPITLSVVIVNYNVRHFLEQALQSVRRASEGMAVEVFVVDNNSVDDSVAMVRDRFPEVRLIANADNPGFAVANNQAIRQARGRYVLLLNPDTVVEESTFRRCADFMDAHPEAGGLGVRMIDGAGTFLPESKRGFPSPWVAFCKTVGLSRLFPRSRWFNEYHLGYLPEDEIHEVDVLAGAFMWLRKSALDEVGLLDEAFFMYGEDIDLSYRLVQAGYKNVYFPRTTILHYKGESTKKGSLNYVRTFYQAMIIFARKHFQGSRARLFVAMLQGGIYLRALLTLISNGLRRVIAPLMDAALIYGGLVFLRSFWATYHFRDPDYYDERILYVNFPLYTAIWVASVFLSGGYDRGGDLRRLVRGLLVGTLVLAAVYGFLGQAWRSSRALILLGAVWALLVTVGLRYLMHFIRYRNLNVHRDEPDKLVIVGSREESQRVRRLLAEAHVRKNFIGTVSPGRREGEGAISTLDRLEEVVRIYRVEELIFCARDVPAQDIMHWMTRLGPSVAYKIVPAASLSIIGSSNRNASGELYTIDIQYQIVQPWHRRNKRLQDLAMALFLLLTWPIQLLWVRNPWTLLTNALAVLAGRRSWVGYIPSGGGARDLPPLRPGVLHPADVHPHVRLNEATRHRLNFLYAKDYHPSRDLEIMWSCWRMLGKKQPRLQEKQSRNSVPSRK